ncbi:MAG: hypothetical protein RIQ89_865 [Bacteroidota bacterium]|jgi:predicted transcriptional regulator
MSEIEALSIKNEKIQHLNKELSKENEELFHQYNHLMIRNNKFLKRIEDQQKLIESLYERISELQHINSKLLKLNDGYRNHFSTAIDKRKANVIPSNDAIATLDPDDIEALYERWKLFPGQLASNGPNLRKQMVMLLHLSNNPMMNAADLFQITGVGGVTGARYVSVLKKAGLIKYSGARKKGYYEITEEGIAFVEGKLKLHSHASLSDGMPGLQPKGIKIDEVIHVASHSHLAIDSMDL